MQLGLPFDSRDTKGVVSVVAPPVEPGVERPQVYFVRHRRARRYVVRVDRDGRVRVTIPRSGSRREADAFVERQAQWIAGQRAKAAERAMPAPEQRRLRQLAKQMLPVRLHEMAAGLGLTVAKISIRDQRSRWGSCGRDGHICLNWRLVQMPDWVRDYVLVHELMHLRRMDHSPKYWQLVAVAYPRYQDARVWLRAYGRQLV